MQQLTEPSFNLETERFEQIYQASDGCRVVLDVECLEDEWFQSKASGRTYSEFKDDRLQQLGSHPHQNNS